MTRRMTISIVLALILGCAQAALAGPVNCCLYGTTGATGGSTLVQLDPVTGALVRTIGPVGYDVNGLAWDPLTQTMYAGTSYNDPVFNGLIAIDLTTGAGAQVGANLWGSADPDGYPQAAVALTISATGQMFAWCEDCYDITVGYYRDDLVSINRTTGVATRVGDSGISTGALGLDFDANGTLTLVNGNQYVYTVDTSTGATTWTNVTLQTWTHHGKFNPTTGDWWGIDQSGNGNNPRDIVVFNLGAGSTVQTLPTVDDLHTLEFVIPEPGTWLLLGLGLAGLGALQSKLVPMVVGRR